MRLVPCAALLILSLLAVQTANPADDLIEHLATCQSSWLDWKDDPVRTKTLAESFNAAFVRKSNSQAWVPRRSVLVVGLPVVQAFPESVGMGVGFSVTLDANFDKARPQVEKAIGKALENCETGDGMRSCGLEVGQKRTLMLMAGDNGKSKTTLLGCYYYYEK